MAVIEGHSFPLIFVLMTSKTQTLYQATISTIKDLFPELLPQSMMGDFELAPRNSMEAAFPEAILGGCQFHFSQNLWKRIQKLGLAKTYTENAAFKKYVKEVMSLPYLPSEHITTTMESLFLQQLELSDHENMQNRKFQKYVKKYWIRTISPEKLSVFHLSRGTNNDHESFHSRLKSRIKTKQPNAWVFLSELNELMEDVALDIERCSKGMQITRPRKKTVLNNISRRNALKGRLARNEISPLRYISAIAHTFDSQLSKQERDFSSDDSSSEDQVEEAEVVSINCPVCLQPRETTFALLPCFHGFCGNCSLTLININSHCPQCRGEVTGRQRVYL